MTEAPIAQTDNAALLGGLGIVAYAASMLTHEALGHGGYCLFLGGHTVMLTAWAESCHSPHPQSAAIQAAGPLTQFVAGLVAWLVLRVGLLPAHFANLRFSVLLLMAFDLLIASGYVAFSGLTDFGDAAVIISGFAEHGVWRGVLVLAGGATYYVSLLLVAVEFRRFVGSDRGTGTLKRLVWIPYLTTGVMACCAAALNSTVPRGAALGLAAASSFGGALGLLWVPTWKLSRPARMPAARSRVTWSIPWFLAAIIVAAAFIAVLGPGIRFGAPASV